MVDDLVNKITNKPKSRELKSHLSTDAAILFEDTRTFQSLEAVQSLHYCN